ncbi:MULTISPECIES: BREX-1 system adenine-specific DNA-methyltransferase PglX [unclassified Candidatus Frackibacter]|uniref:BREX-1 system adenine-specific DNA-methyltransferase PglX n=1 Tax=unclassified Candidatus Frackibacter TaxID=2648818 RepID=UPI00088942A0|nr:MULTISPECIES: BREX-1 system adenine-specific DNA-methyltransferase PglX [unclassified Candidatus Frackibacter]SDC85400.1 Methyltransferase domain-containing protein [Candidatus Frackibacter sp. WG11]SEM99683.1 Methyltransferase domain-containing protein [Candidatus Frackibacter sp. WG12]SFM07758.1 Methyltransferase domain-containing protein [Candidatus Frackibacter sp. WG13]
MDKTAIKNFAVKARNKLIEQVKQRAFYIGIKEDEIVQPREESSDSITIGERILNKKEVEQRKELIQQIEEKGYEQVMDEVAYTWFNRFVALRYMEVNDYLPTGVRVLSSVDGQQAEPDIIREALNVNLDIEEEKVYQYQDNNDTEGLYKYLLIQQCNSLHEIMPFIFEEIADYTEILLPDNLLAEGSVINELVTEIEEDDWKEGVEIIGWLYQFYISEKKDEVIQAKKKYKKEEIPFATQLFTPDWIVRYMVQNSLGRYWLESHPDEELKEKWEYYLENPNPEDDWEEKLEPYINKEMKVEDIKVFDPACGSGHILVYVFDVLFQIYERAGYVKREISRMIIENNLYGLDIDDRAYQLACLSVAMKGREYNRRFFKDIKRNGLELNIASIQETNNFTEEDIVYLAGEDEGENYDKTKKFIEQFKDAKIYGSLIDIEEFDKEFLENRLEKIKDRPAEDLFEAQSREKILYFLPYLIKQAEIMNDIYDVLVTNPPYIGSRYMNSKLKKFIRNNYPDCRRDLFAAFVKYSFKFVHKSGQLGFMSPFVWMFISSYEDFRTTIVEEKTISSLIQLEYSGFAEATVPICTFTLRNSFLELPGEYVKLSDFSGVKNQSIKTLEAVKNPSVYYRYTSYSNKFTKISSTPIAYWASDKVRNIFEKGTSLSNISKPRQGLATGKNKRFLRLWSEVNINKIGFGLKNKVEAKKTNLTWFPYNKGGKFRKWYGNSEYIINWKNDGAALKKFEGSVLRNTDFYFKQGITWTDISSSKFGVRYTPVGYLFDVSGSSVFPSEEELHYITGLLCSKLAYEFLVILNPTMHFQVGNISDLPIIKPKDNELKEKIEELVQQNIQIAKNDWDSFETSWNFKQHPLLEHKNGATKIEEAFNNWAEFAENQFYELKENEEELNRIFIDIYGLEDELDPEVEEKDVTIRKADRERDIKSFISYAVGCMLGRYSLDVERLAYAGGEFDESKYQTFKPNESGIIPICKDEYFEDDIVTRFIEFLKVTFGEENLEDNLQFIVDALPGRSKDPRERLRKYFLTKSRFYKDHTRRYNKRPIYWLFQSDSRGKAFNALIYMHRYDKGTVSKVRIDYLHELQKKLEAEKKRLQGIIDSDMSSSDKAKARKRLDSIDKDLKELVEYDKKLNHVANQQIEIDLDDGVKENYPKFEDVLAKI